MADMVKNSSPAFSICAGAPYSLAPLAWVISPPLLGATKDVEQGWRNKVMSQHKHF